MIEFFITSQLSLQGAFLALKQMICYTGYVEPGFGICINVGSLFSSKYACRSETKVMKRILATIQIIIIVLIIGFATWQLFLGNFDQAFASFPLLIIYYVFIIARQRRQ
jgi:hypothetical protein